MEPAGASEHLQVIRTLMERAALYRRALAPIMILAGVIGTVAAAVALLTERFNANATFAALWLGTGVCSLAVSYLLARRQALKEQEPFWSPPTRRVSQALLPGFAAGGIAGAVVALFGAQLPPVAWLVAITWLLAYGCALHAAGFFMQRGIKLFGLGFVCAGAVLLVACCALAELRTARVAHAIMGVFFGVLHLLYGAYLHFTERRSRA